MRWIQRRRDIDQTVLRQHIKLAQETDHALNDLNNDTLRSHESALVRVIHHEDAAMYVIYLFV